MSVLIIYVIICFQMQNVLFLNRTMKQQKIKTQMSNSIIIGDKQIIITCCVIQHKLKIIAIAYHC